MTPANAPRTRARGTCPTEQQSRGLRRRLIVLDVESTPSGIGMCVFGKRAPSSDEAVVCLNGTWQARGELGISLYAADRHARGPRLGLPLE